MNKKTTVLIVDDEVEIRTMVSIWLKTKGLETITAENGDEAFKIIQSQKIDFVVSDVRMPICDGKELLRKIKKEYPDTPAILLVTGQSEMTREEALNCGAQNLLSKPFDLEILFAEIQDAID